MIPKELRNRACVSVDTIDGNIVKAQRLLDVAHDKHNLQVADAKMCLDLVLNTTALLKVMFGTQLIGIMEDMNDESSMDRRERCGVQRIPTASPEIGE
jgi:hypothetical protein